jgi:hypothetical protein
VKGRCLLAEFWSKPPRPPSLTWPARSRNWFGRVAACVKPGPPAEVAPRSPKEAPTAGTGEPLARKVSAERSATEVCLNALDDNHNQIIDEGCNEPQGDVFFALAWSDPSAKLDLIVTDPRGELAPIGRATPLGLVRARDCPGQDRACQGMNYETSVLEGEEPVTGTFVVRVRFEGTEPAGQRVRAQLGVRTPGEVVQYLITFTRPGTEFVLPVKATTGHDP